MQCKHCGVSVEGSRGTFANHVRWCSKNPKVATFKEENATRKRKHLVDKFGENVEFNVVCEKCNTQFSVVEREHLHPQRGHYFCSRRCANSVGGRAKADKHHADHVASYTTVAWRYHEKKCVVCNEELIVAVHHLDENHENNDPKNLVPLCPTHHQYMHSRYRKLIKHNVDEYVLNKWRL